MSKNYLLNSFRFPEPFGFSDFDRVFKPFVRISEDELVGIRSNIKETDISYIIEAVLAGYNKDEISVEMSEGYLTISAESKNETEDKKDNYVKKEIRRGKVVRSYEFNDVDEDGIKAKYENGILTVEVPKAVKNVSKKRVNID